MECEKLRELLVLASGGDVTQEEWQQVRDHIGRCDECRRLYEAYCEDRRRLESLRGLRMREALRAELASRGRRVMRRPLPWIVHFGAAAAVALLLTLFLLQGGTPTTAPRPPSTTETAPLVVDHLPESLKNAFEGVSVEEMGQQKPKYERCRLLREADTTVDF